MERPLRPLQLAALLLTCACAAPAPPDEFRLQGPAHYLDGFPARTARGHVNVVVEIPAGTLAKWEVAKDDGALEWEFVDGTPRVVRYLGYPGNYGMIPGTYLPESEGGDGDPLDVLVLGAALDRGAVVPVRLIGVLEMLDRGERDDKLIGVLAGTAMDGVGSIDELDASFPGCTTIVRTWFENYKGPGKIVVDGFSGPSRAEELVAAAVQAYLDARDSRARSTP